MDIKKLLMDLETHPVVVAIAFFLIVFVGYNVLKKKNNSTSTVDTGTGYKDPQSETFYNFPPGALPTGITIPTVPPPQPTPILPVKPPIPIPVKPPSPVHCDKEKLNACIAQYNTDHPQHKKSKHEAHHYCWSLMPECK